jgi:hypothetical protein
VNPVPGHHPAPTPGEVYYKPANGAALLPSGSSPTPGPVYFKQPHHNIDVHIAEDRTTQGIEVSPKSNKINSPWSPGPTVPWGARFRSTPGPSVSPPNSLEFDSYYDDNAPKQESLMNVLMQNDLTMMAGLVAEVGLDAKLRSEHGPFTVFAPTDKAFNKFLEQFGGGRNGVEKLKRDRKLVKVRE